MCAGGRVIPPPSPTGASNLQPVLHHAGVVSAQNRMTGELTCVAVSPISWQRNLNLCASPRSSSESRRPLDVISVCTRLGQHVTDRIGPYQPQVTGAEFGLGVDGGEEGPVAGQLSGALPCAGLTHLTLRVPVLGSRGLSPSEASSRSYCAQLSI